MKNAEIQQRTSMSDVLVVAQTLKWEWEGHVARTDQCRWAHATPMWDVIKNSATEVPIGSVKIN